MPECEQKWPGRENLQKNELWRLKNKSRNTGKNLPLIGKLKAFLVAIKNNHTDGTRNPNKKSKMLIIRKFGDVC